MPIEYKVRLKIVSQKGKCAFGHAVGQEFDVSRATPEGLCPSAYHCAYPSIFALRCGGLIPWEKEEGTAHVACLDPDNPVVMKIIREA